MDNDLLQRLCLFIFDVARGSLETSKQIAY